ncbi:hypothetical protein BGZ60DRAFT_411520 [Tricladium varicosporioides]|nr:hypothetical protein BGZ60DRAFT_411520 [Hymenoscyphus varicosporioides]
MALLLLHWCGIIRTRFLLLHFVVLGIVMLRDFLQAAKFEMSRTACLTHFHEGRNSEMCASSILHSTLLSETVFITHRSLNNCHGVWMRVWMWV